MEERGFSSSLIRGFLSRGEVEAVKGLLGRPYFLEGNCKKGEGRGRKIGFPTLNIALEERLAIRSGVYLCHLIQEGKRYPSVANIGRAPTFHNQRERLLEVHVLNFEPLVKKAVRVEVVEFLREERKFSEEEALQRQILDDIQKAKSLLGSEAYR